MARQFFIVTEHAYKRHADIDAAQAEKARLAAKHPDKQFRVMRCKTGLASDSMFEKLLAYVRAIVPICVASGLTESALKGQYLLDRYDQREAEAAREEAA